VLTGTGTGGASVGTPSKLRTGVWDFPVTGLSIGTVNAVVAPDTNDITYVDGGASVPSKSWSFIAMPGVTFTSGALDVDGTSGADTITVAVSGGDLTLNGAKVDMGSGDILASDVTSIVVDGLAGIDTIDLSAVTSTDFTGSGLSGNITVNGGSGNDMITGSGLADTLIGGTGDDQIEGGLGNDTTTGEEGDDTYGSFGKKCPTC
jgi:Ca2+-binding RTX toxin-like protein